MIIKIKPKDNKHYVPFEAWQFTLKDAENYKSIEDWCMGSLKGTMIPAEDRVIELRSVDDYATARVSDYIVRTGPNSFSVMTLERFNDRFEVTRG